MSVTLHVLLEVEHCHEGDVAYSAADPSACHQLGHVSVLQHIGGTAGSMDHQHVGLIFLRSSCHSGCTGPGSRAGWRLTGDLVPRGLSFFLKAFPQVLQVYSQNYVRQLASYFNSFLADDA